MITEDYVSFEIAKVLKEKGFEGECFHTYFDDEHHLIAAPTIQMAMKWLRQKNDIAIEINVGSGSKDCWVSNIIKGYKTENGTYIQTFVKFSYEEACEAAIGYILENLI